MAAKTMLGRPVITETMRDGVREEARILRQLDHKNIVKLVGITIDNVDPILILELMNG